MGTVGLEFRRAAQHRLFRYRVGSVAILIQRDADRNGPKSGPIQSAKFCVSIGAQSFAIVVCTARRLHFVFIVRASTFIVCCTLHRDY
jgi:hypothetical protein